MILFYVLIAWSVLAWYAKIYVVAIISIIGSWLSRIVVVVVVIVFVVVVVVVAIVVVVVVVAIVVVVVAAVIIIIVITVSVVVVVYGSCIKLIWVIVLSLCSILRVCSIKHSSLIFILFRCISWSWIRTVISQNWFNISIIAAFVPVKLLFWSYFITWTISTWLITLNRDICWLFIFY